MTGNLTKDQVAQLRGQLSVLHDQSVEIYKKCAGLIQLAPYIDPAKVGLMFAELGDLALSQLITIDDYKVYWPAPGTQEEDKGNG